MITLSAIRLLKTAARYNPNDDYINNEIASAEKQLKRLGYTKASAGLEPENMDLALNNARRLNDRRLGGNLTEVQAGREILLHNNLMLGNQFVERCLSHEDAQILVALSTMDVLVFLQEQVVTVLKGKIWNTVLYG